MKDFAILGLIIILGIVVMSQVDDVNPPALPTPLPATYSYLQPPATSAVMPTVYAVQTALVATPFPTPTLIPTQNKQGWEAPTGETGGRDMSNDPHKRTP